MTTGETRDLVVRLGKPSERGETLRQLADLLSVEDLLLFVLDPAAGVPVPAPGLPRTVAGGRSWRQFIRACTTDGRREQEVELPSGTARRAVAVTCDGSTAILLGGSPDPAIVAEFERLLPLVAALLSAEQAVLFARAETEAAHQAESHAQVLASALEGARAETAALNARLRHEHEQKDLFLAMLGHELRNPLAPLVTALDGIRLRAGENTAIPRNVIDMMSRQTQQLSRLVEDLLDVSRVSRGRIELRPEVLAITDILERAIEVSQPQLDARSQQVLTAFPQEPLAVYGDRARLVQVFGNLLNNASKYSDPGSIISVTALRQGESVVVEVTDSGIGMSEEIISQVFDLFAQAPIAVDRAEGGLGIGLTLVQRLVQLHDGHVSAYSAGESEGSTFTVSLPVAEARALREADVLPPRQETPAACNVMVVDDNRDAATSMAELLRLMGHRVTVAFDGKAPLGMAESADADAFFLDIGLPGMDGYQLARRLRSCAKDGARFYAVTGYGTPQSDEAAKAAGFDERIVKPVTVDTLRRLLDGRNEINDTEAKATRRRV